MVHAALLGLLAARVAYLALHADVYLASPWTALDLRDGGGFAPAGLVAGLVGVAQPTRALAAPCLAREQRGGVALY